MLTNTELHILSPNNYTCNINKINFLEKLDIYILYLIENIVDNSFYWGIRVIGSNHYMKPICKINIKENGDCETYYDATFRSIHNSIGYHIYVPSVKLYTIPSKYKIIPNDKRKWNELCQFVEKYNSNSQISVIINVHDLKEFISTFL